LIKSGDFIYQIVQRFLVKYLNSKEVLQNYSKVLDLIRPVSINDSRFELIRIGSKYDGGYVIPQFLKYFSTLYSIGIGDNNDFELALSGGLKVFQFDHTIESPPKSNSNMFFEPKGVSKINSKKFLTIDKILESEKQLLSIILKLDVEGSEFEALNSSKRWEKVGAIIIEFHQLQKFVLGINGYKYSDILDRLKANFQCFHVHANNCCGFFEGINWRLPKVVELTLVNKSLINGLEWIPNHRKFPIDIDSPNLQGVPELYLGDLYSDKGIGFS
jgi:hypothetical protein